MTNTTEEHKTRAALYAKIAAVTAAVKRIPKNGRNTFFGYSYALESDITDGLRDLLLEHRVAFLPPTVLSWERSVTGQKGGDLTRVQYQFALADCDTGEILESCWWSEAQDPSDKGFNKAATAAAKYWLMKTFLIATGDDPDSDPISPSPGSQKAATQGKSTPAQQRAPAADATPPADAQRPAEPQPGSVEQSSVATEAQRRKIYSDAHRAGWSDESLKQHIITTYGVESSRDLTKVEASEIIDYIAENKGPAMTPTAPEQGVMV